MTLYATDLDGTLLRSDMSVSENSIEKLNALIDNGLVFTYASARSFSSASPLVKKIHLNCPAVTFNGVFVVDPQTGEHIFENVFSEESLDFAREFFIANNLAPLVYSIIDGRERVSYIASRLGEVRGYVESRKDDRRLRAVEGYEQLFEGRVFYFTLFNPPMDSPEMDEAFSRENGFARNIMYDTYEPETLWYEVFSKDASKASALLTVAEYLHANRLVCFGDNTNDMSMLLAADVGIAVSNATEQLRANADIVIKSNDEDAVADYLAETEAQLLRSAKKRGRAKPAAMPARESKTAARSAKTVSARKPKPALPCSAPDSSRFSAALGAAMTRVRGVHGSVGTQNEKLIHATLKNYYVPEEYSQEIRLGSFIADAVSEDGIFEIQTRSLYALRDKLRAFLELERVTVVHPVELVTRTVYISEDTGEVIKETPPRRCDPKMKIFEELYSIREFLENPRLTIILARLRVDKRVYFKGNSLPDLRIRNVRKKVRIEKVPLELIEETRLGSPQDYAIWLPKGLPAQFTKKEFCRAAKESDRSLRLEVLRTAGVIRKVGVNGKSYLYSVSDEISENI